MIALTFFVLAGIAEAVMDTLQFHFYRSWFGLLKSSFWDPKESWKNKYKLNDPMYGPKFFGSTTIFVGLTDAWHLFKLLRNLFLFVGVFFIAYNYTVFWNVLHYVVLARIAFGVSFTLFYKML